MNKALYSTGKDDWETPPELFGKLDAEFHFTLDPCATVDNAKCLRYFTEAEDGLTQDWKGEQVFCNPPYSSGKQDRWIQKCYEEGRKPDTLVVALLPARTDTKRFHRYILGKAEIRFLEGRVRFVGAPSVAPFPSMVVVWRNDRKVGTKQEII